MENAVTRVAVLGLDSQVGAQRLARLLVADPLKEKGAWEEELETNPEQGAVLLRYVPLQTWISDILGTGRVGC